MGWVLLERSKQADAKRLSTGQSLHKHSFVNAEHIVFISETRRREHLLGTQESWNQRRLGGGKTRWAVGRDLTALGKGEACARLRIIPPRAAVLLVVVCSW